MISHSACIQLLTQRPSGHTLNRRQVLSPDRKWCVFDARNNDPDIGITRSIERVQIATGQIEHLYSPPNPSPFGPGVAAAAYHPFEEKVVFIHGLLSCSEEHPYGMTRRFGAILETNSRHMSPMETRFASDPVPVGGLSGGTHAHSWSPNGKRISFTYNDVLAPNLNRTVGFACLKVPPPSIPARDNESFKKGEEFTGVCSSYLLQHCSPKNRFYQALEECWVDDEHLAFLADLGTKEGKSGQFEIMVAKLPEDRVLSNLSQERSESVSFTAQGSPSIEPLVTIELRTELSDRKYAGIQGPRHWLVADSKRDSIYSLWKDDRGEAQLIRVQWKTGVIEQLTDLDAGIEGQFSLSEDGERIAFVASGQMHWFDINTGETHRVEVVDYQGPSGGKIEPIAFDGSYVGAPHFIDRNSWLINRYVASEGGRYLQILVVKCG